jgi:hypothetical protein
VPAALSSAPLSTALSHLLIAFTIELDNEFEHRFAQAGSGARVASVVMWSNFLRLVGHGIAAGELPAATGLPKARVLSTLGGMERWRYVSVGPTWTTKRDGYGSGRGVRDEWLVRPTAPGETARQIWPRLSGEIESCWEERFGAREVGDLRTALAAIAEQVEAALPEYLPVVVGSTGMVAEVPHRPRSGEPPTHLLARLAQVLLAYALDFERASDVSLPLSANVLRVLDQEEQDVRDLPVASAVSPEAIAMALTSLKKQGYAEVRDKSVRLTAKGRDARGATPAVHESVLRDWEARFGRTSIVRLRTAADVLLEQRDGTRAKFALGLEPYPDGWRAERKYLPRTEAMLEDPATGLPQYPMVLHRGGWPDGS